MNTDGHRFGRREGEGRVNRKMGGQEYEEKALFSC
jgi:hypothetical protein